MTHHFAQTGLALCATLAVCSACRGAEPSALAVKAVSPRAGLLFTDKEPVDVRVWVTGATSAATVSYTVEESEGPWRDSGTVTLPAPRGGSAEKRLPLRLPGRGLYRLALEARSGGAAAAAQTCVAVVFAPRKPDPASPWGIFYTPHVWFDRANANGPREAAQGHRLLGASWSRLNFWAHSYDRVTVTAGNPPRVTAAYATWKQYARELRRQDISIMGEISQCPRELSSRPDETGEAGDAGPIYNRVKPADYALWGQLIARVAADFRDEIQVWEIWNEANLTNAYWTGTVEDLAELVKQTSQALRRGNPKARIAAAGFVGGVDFADRLFTLGMGKHLDILSVHYTDESPGVIEQWQGLLRKHSLSLPIWNTEERSEVPLHNLAGAIERSFKFIHVNIGYPDFRPLVEKDLTVRPAGILFSVGAHCIGSARPAGGSDRVPGWDALFFGRGREMIGAFQQKGVASLLGGTASVTLAVEPLGAGVPPAVTDRWGRSRPLAVRDGRATLSLASSPLFINGCRRLEVVGAESAAGPGGARVFEAESGRWSPGWGNNGKPGFSGGRILELWAEGAPDGGYWAEVDLDVPADGRYEVVFSGNALSRLAKPRSISPFEWSLDGGEKHMADDALPVLSEVTGLGEPPSVLGVATLTKGRHTFRLRLTGPRDEPDQMYALWFDAVVLRPR